MSEFVIYSSKTLEKINNSTHYTTLIFFLVTKKYVKGINIEYISQKNSVKSSEGTKVKLTLPNLNGPDRHEVILESTATLPKMKSSLSKDISKFCNSVGVFLLTFSYYR